MKRLLLWFVFVCVLMGGAAVGGGYYVYNQFINTPSEVAEPYVLNVKPGMGFNEITSILTQEKVISAPLLFKVFARIEGIATQVKTGEVLFEGALTPKDIAQKLISNDRIEYKFTIVEGMNFKELVAKLKSNSNLTHAMGDMSTEALLEAIGSAHSHPEGLFLADTYRFRKGESDLSILRRASSLLNRYLDDQWQQRDKTLPYKSAYEALIMASIVEKETGRAVERPMIAGVFVRRLNKKMKLQTDPTVIYGMGDAYNGNIRRKDLRKPTPYNTYVIPALPPTPIAMVGREAINAAFNPKDGKALFFVAKGDGSHYFSATLAEHNKAVREYQLSRKSDYRSSP